VLKGFKRKALKISVTQKQRNWIHSQ